jgi:hypothetical protein
MNIEYHRSWSMNDTPSFHDMLIKREETVKQQLAIYIENLNCLEIRKAQYGLDVPTHLSNEIEYTRKQIHRLIRELQCKEDILSELEALSQDEHSGSGKTSFSPVATLEQ